MTGSIVNSLKTAIGREPIIMGKPYRTMWEVLQKEHNLDPSKSIMIGDRLDTDIAMAANCSLGYSLAVLSGVTNEEEIMRVSKVLENDNFSREDQQAKIVPDFYANCLGDFGHFLSEV
jgi:ribonucleotide monophosphatase NagD (HAD superfamily)